MKTDDLMIFHPSSREEIEALKAFAKALKIKFEIAKEKGYNKDFVEKIKRSKKQHLDGKDVVIKTEDLWK
jgi:phosphoribosylamine-glycine ligase